jgi:DNA polymerase V
MSKVTILQPVDSQLELPVYETTVPAGFPSPAQEYLGDTMDLNDYLIKNKTASFIAKVEGNSMIDAGIFEGDLVVVDRALTAKNRDIVIAAVNHEFTIKRLSTKEGIKLIPENKEYEPIVMSGENELVIWGVVTALIRKF